MDLREELRRVLCADGILHASAGQPLVHRDGSHAPWAFYSWQVTLKERGLRLAAVNLLRRLRKFKSTQLAAYGFTAQPLMNACVLLGGGRYTGLAVREQHKQTVACRQVDGPLDRSRPVVLIDDSLSSGTSLSLGIHALEKDGFQVEGAVALVYFPGRGGLEWAEAAGYHVEYLFDVWSDLGYPLEPGQGLGQMPSSTGVSDALNPAVAARQIAEYFLAAGRAPKPPAGFDRNCGGQGGVFVSFRRRTDDYRVARSGFWHFDPKAACPARDLVQATVLTLREAGGAITADNLAEYKIAVTFLGPLELIQPKNLDFDRHGIVVRSRRDPERVGGALPNTQVFTSEIAQYLHARDNNARLDPGEPHDLFRHTIKKYVEPDTDWPPYGSEAPREDRRAMQAFGDWLTGRACLVVRAVLENRKPVRPGRVPLNPGSPHHFVAVSLYRNGFLERGISGGQSHAVDVLTAAAEAAGKLRRRLRGKWRGPRPAILVTLLHDPESYGYEPISYVAHKLRAGLDALAGETDADRQILLPTALVHNNWSKSQFVTALADQFRPSGDQVQWTGFKTTGWLRTADTAARIRQGFVVCLPAARVFSNHSARHLAGEMGAYIFRHLDRARIPDYYYHPMADAREPRGTAARAVHALDALAQAGVILRRRKWVLAAHAGLRSFLKHIDSSQGGQLCAPDMEGGGLAECVLLAALARNGDKALVNNSLALALAQRVGGFFLPSGAISEFPETVLDQLHDYLPGAALLAVGRLCAARNCGPPAGLGGHLEWCRRRFHHCPSWGMAGWLPQGWGELYQLMRDKHQAELVFEVADWALDRQLSKNGAFLEELSPEEPSFNTGFIAEGIAAAWRTALRCRERARARRYEASWRAACAFVETLVIKPEDTFCMPYPEAAIGGVRTMASRCDVRIDQVSHGLHALAAGLNNLLSN